MNTSPRIILLLILAGLLVVSGPLWGMEPDQILVLANRNASRSIGLAREYMEKRAIPDDQFLALWVTDKETCTREDYEKKVLGPVLAYLKKHPEKDIRCLVTLYGMPLQILPPKMTAMEQARYDSLEREQTRLGKALQETEKQTDEADQLTRESERVRDEMARVMKKDHRAALDSELALALAAPYELSRWIPNPYFLGFQGKTMPQMPPREKVLMVARLDGPSPQVVRRIVDDAIEVEKKGLQGKAYFDARWPRPAKEKEPKNIGYGFYDLSIHKAAERVHMSGRMPVVLNAEGALFQPGDCPAASLYCGWYQLAHYVDAFEWQPGAVGYHIASSECATLSPGSSQVWCKRMLEEGVAATIGPVSEPFVQAFPIPEMFFGLLLEGRWALAECYALSLPFLSWQMVLVGDPLYRPFQFAGVSP